MDYSPSLQASVKKVKPTEHRLELKKGPGDSNYR
jgi:hypothetical protein